MISVKSAKRKCCEDISLIENYEQAITDTTQMWHCHHRGEILPCGNYSSEDLQKFGLYWKRPACELIFLTPSEHRSLHNKGENNPMFGKSRGKPVQQLTFDGELIATFPSVQEASRQTRISNICKACNGKKTHAGGFVWRYAE